MPSTSSANPSELPRDNDNDNNITTSHIHQHTPSSPPPATPTKRRFDDFNLKDKSAQQSHPQTAASSGTNTAAPPDPKRSRSELFAASSATHPTTVTTTTTPTMSAKLKGKRPASGPPEVIDLTQGSNNSAGSSPVPTSSHSHIRGLPLGRTSTAPLNPKGGGMTSKTPGGTNYLQTHIGARRLVVKNLRPVATQTQTEEAHYARIRGDLDAALKAVFSGHGAGAGAGAGASAAPALGGHSPSPGPGLGQGQGQGRSGVSSNTTTGGQPMEKLYRGVEDICRRGNKESGELYEWLKDRCKGWLNSDKVLKALLAAAPSIATDAGGEEDVILLRAVLAAWKRWIAQLLVIRWIFSYLDRSYLLPGGGGTTAEGKGKSSAGGKREGPTSVNDMGISAFRSAMYSSRSRNGANMLTIGARVVNAVCVLVMFDRLDDNRFDSQLLRESVAMLRLWGVYGKELEPKFINESREYVRRFAEERSESCGLKEYIVACERLLNRESERCDVYNFDSTTKRQLKDDAHQILIFNYAEKLLDSGSVAKLLDANDLDSMKALYELLKLSGIQKRLKGPWEQYIRKTGAAIVSDTARGDEMIIRMLQLRRALDVLIRDAFGRDEDFTYGLRDAFGFFINDKSVSSSWNTGTSKVGEMIAKHIDMLLRGGLKTLPKALLSDVKDRQDAERSGIASTADEDAELDRQLDHSLELFRFIQGKDIFEAFYKKDLARRLLMGRSASRDAERNMLAKLKNECGSSFTHNLEIMFKDQELAKDEIASYKTWLAGRGEDSPVANSDLDLSVNVLSAAAWPTYPDVRVLLPQNVLDHITTFDTYYKSKHTGRRLTWKHNLAHCVVKARFDRGPKELLVSAFQAIVLVLFNEAEEKSPDGILSYDQLASATGMPDPELQRTLQSLACGKTRVLNKHPKGREVDKTDTFSVNKSFTDPKFRVKINQIQLKETKEENKETHERVAQDRQFETQAAIVRIMKSRKKMAHAQLVAEVINQTKQRGAVDAADIKANIEKLIEKDYIEREGGNYVYLA
ncbi:Cullin family-domain-containing protein [Neurospora tetraspora]|uniref:Cullin family-domain-containing protein n=1 Tax=Neurospora tetraspora TaxID=94610 RepID=A0AAE0JB66_9PEZI|nr:Cullin family-domain-containing protein [Neurospora tetraspora]